MIRKITYVTGIEYLNSLATEAMELPFVRSVNITPIENRDVCQNIREKLNFHLTAHGSYFVNMNAKEGKKRKVNQKVTKGLNALAYLVELMNFSS